jgi:DNA repair protein RecO (recombination protein O)
VALYRCEAVVLRVQPLGEADRLATLLAPDLGKLRAVARGAQKGRSHLAAAIQPFVRARLLLWQGRSLDGISQAEILTAPRQLAQELARFSAAAYCCELADALAVERQEAVALYGYLASALELLDAPREVPDPAVVLRWFELGALGGAGFGPELAVCAGCGAALGEPAARTRFSARAGGALCAPCGAAAAEGVWVGRSALRALRHLLAARATAVPAVRVGPRTMGQMDEALSHHIAAVLQRPLRSRALLDTLS